MSIFGEAASLAETAIPGAGPAAWALKHWKLILSSIGFAILGAMLVFAKADARHWHKQSDQNAAALAGEIAKNKVNLASISALQDVVAQKNAESDARAKALADSVAQDVRDRAAADKLAKTTDTRIATLQGLAQHAEANPACRVPDALTKALEGL